jgi:hypothetical protein
VHHPTADPDEVVHQRARLGILAILAEANEVDFGYLRQTLKLTDGNLSGHLQVLERAGLITLTKGYEGKRPARGSTSPSMGVTPSRPSWPRSSSSCSTSSNRHEPDRGEHNRPPVTPLAAIRGDRGSTTR